MFIHESEENLIHAAEKGNKRAKHVLTVDLETTTDDFSSPISKMKARCNGKHLKLAIYYS